MGSDYVDGAGIAYYMAGFALLTRAAFSQRRRMSLMLAGVFAAAAIHTNLFWCVPASLLAIHYCAMAMIQTKEWRRAIFDLLLWYPAGFLALTGLLAAINFWVVGYPWFYMASIRFLRSSGTVSRYAHYGAFGWPLHQWLKYPLVTLLAAFPIQPSDFGNLEAGRICKPCWWWRTWGCCSQYSPPSKDVAPRS